jgi:hypothetical protein
MKKKIFFAIATAFFAVATVFNMNALQGGSVGDISLDAIAVMAQAQSENNDDNVCNDCQYYMQDVTCIRFFYTSDGRKYAVYVGNRLKCKTPGTGTCTSTDC